MPLLSIIIPSYNNLILLQNCIDSIERQTFRDFEVIVVDGRSTDGTLNYLKSLKEPFNWVSEPDQGIYDAMNKGVAISRGEWLYFIGADDFLFTENVFQGIFKNEITDDIGLIIGKVQYDISSNNSILIKRNNGLFVPSWSNKLWIKNSLHHQGIIYRSNLFFNHNYNTRYKILADYDFNLGLFIKKEKVNIIDQIIAVSKADGISKNFVWQLYKEDINLKTRHSSVALIPFFYILGFCKYLLKKVV